MPGDFKRVAASMAHFRIMSIMFIVYMRSGSPSAAILIKSTLLIALYKGSLRR